MTVNDQSKHLKTTKKKERHHMVASDRVVDIGTTVPVIHIHQTHTHDKQEVDYLEVKVIAISVVFCLVR